MHKSISNMKQSKGMTELDSAPHTSDSKKSKNEPSLLDLQNNIIKLFKFIGKIGHFDCQIQPAIFWE